MSCTDERAYKLFSDVYDNITCDVLLYFVWFLFVWVESCNIPTYRLSPKVCTLGSCVVMTIWWLPW